ncbi:hypothetical protein B0H17DRAFT_1086819 [Mycena rosella]|uniref:Tetratricopeptide repeat protein n=1 Tax=Mycena rosella TaxID=1033263 RepID=A0AAD7G5F6_MYCRO|nr:hypothetical protein B0H17DRAFT_1086819 [Mycena rosella]
MDVHHSRANCILRLGDLAQQRGQFMKAVELWENARPLFERSSQMSDVAQIDARFEQHHQSALADLLELNAPSESLEALSILKDTNCLEAEV